MMKANHRKQEARRSTIYRPYHFTTDSHGKMPKVAIVKRARYEADAFEVWISPDMKTMLGQGFETEDAAQQVADAYNRKDKRK